MTPITIDLDALADAIAERVASRLARQQSSATLLTRAQVAERLNRSASTVKRLQMQLGFPKPVRLGGGRPMWRAAEVDAWAGG
jgi:predicted DNA-binding transcriptional regulator AlpA